MFSFLNPYRIANKIIVLVMLLLLIAFILWGSLTYSSSREEILKAKNSQLNEMSFRLAHEIGNFFLPLHLELALISKQISRERNNVDEKIRIYFHQLLNSRLEIEEISLINSTGKEHIRISRMSGISSVQLRDFSTDKLITNTLKGKTIASSIEFSEYLEPNLRIIKKMEKNNKTQLILSVINLKWLWDVVQHQKIEANGIVYVVDESMQLVAHPDPSLVLSKTKISELDVSKSFFSHKIKQNFSIYRSFTGELVAGIAKFDDKNRWWIIVEEPLTDALAPLDRIVERFILGFILSSLITIVSVIIFSKRIMKPLENLEKAIFRLSQGESDIHLEVPKSTELSSLSLAFNLMDKNLCKKTQELNFAIHKVNQANEAKSDFLSNMSHELRTPLHSILSFSKMGIRKTDSASKEKISSYFEKIENSGSRLLALVNDLLDLSKLESGKFELNLEKNDLIEIFEQVLSEYEIILQDKNIELIVNEPQVDTHLLCDATKVAQVIRNLISNAVKFTLEGTQIEVLIDNDSNNKNNLIFSIVDEGIGIPNGEFDIIFNKFIQSSKTKSGAGGTGLGLPISKEIIDQHKGIIYAENSDRGGARFSFSIPIEL